VGIGAALTTSTLAYAAVNFAGVNEKTTAVAANMTALGVLTAGILVSRVPALTTVLQVGEPNSTATEEASLATEAVTLVTSVACTTAWAKHPRCSQHHKTLSSLVSAPHLESMSSEDTDLVAACKEPAL
jgi:hypothetical protein